MTYGALSGKAAVYTAIFGDYDAYKEPPAGDYDLFLITDRPELYSPAHAQVIQVPESFDHRPDCDSWSSLDSTRRARFWKICSHLPCNPVSAYEYSLWLDASFELPTLDVQAMIKKYLNGAEVALPRHPWIDCIYWGGERAIELSKEDPTVIRAHLTRYRDAGYPAHRGLGETRILLRRHTPTIARFNEFWWNELRTGSKRDQVSFNYCIDTLRVPVAYFEKPRGEEFGFIVKPHRNGTRS